MDNRSTDGIVSAIHASNFGDFYRITAAIIKRYRKPIHMQSAKATLAKNLFWQAR